ncbi:MAG: hypothetical protein BWK78_05295, partial [Thiotrichaceae bacterium IS1]
MLITRRLILLSLLWDVCQAANGAEQFLLNRLWPQSAIEHLTEKLKTLPTNDSRRVLITIEISELSRLLPGLKEQQANTFAEEALKQARALKDPVLLAKALNALGNVLSQTNRDYVKAVEVYQNALEQISAVAQPQLAANILMNIAQLWIDMVVDADEPTKQHLFQNDEATAIKQLKSAWEAALVAARRLPLSEEKLEHLIHLSQMAREIKTTHWSSTEQTALTQTVYSILDEVRQVDVSKFPRAVSYANGWLGTWYQEEHRDAEALPLLRQAMFYAQQVQAYDILYLWGLQLGRLFKARGDLEEALTTYELARSALAQNYLRFQLATTYYQNRVLSFRETEAGQVYLELFELLLQTANRTGKESDERQHNLKQAQEVIEEFKAGEIENYFHDDCLKDQLAKRTERPALTNTAAFYPIIFKDRIELLLQTPERFILLPAVKMTSQQLDHLVKYKLLAQLAKPADTKAVAELRATLQQLYQLFIRPLEPYIASLDTLVIVPDEILRTIPFAALFDGERYLVEKKVLVTTSALSLTDHSSATDSSSPTVLLNGLTTGSTPLPFAKNELEAIQKFYVNHQILLDETFTKPTFLEKIKQSPYSIIHIASHGQFKGRFKDSFLETADGDLDLDDLKKLATWGGYRERPVELLTLSACETASGEADAMLGLSGITMKAGAKTVVGSLWRVNDLSTCYLMEAFYRHYSKFAHAAKALQQAQLQLLTGNFDQ